MDLHPFLVHFPISLFFLALLFELLRNTLKWIHENTPLLIFVLASIFSIPSSFTGNSAKLYLEGIPTILKFLENHENMGTFVTVSGVIFSFYLVYMKLKYPNMNLSTIKKFIFLIMTLMVFYTGFLGSKIVHEFGPSYQNKMVHKN
tara:strand:- start:1805 stop:2242 length:438 start_codon:yes stop_codon:yes gene_type:complete